MNAIEFVKKYGIAVAKDLAYRDKTSIGYLSVEHYNLNQDNLKQIVEAFELVEKAGGLNNAIAMCAVEDAHYLGCKLPNCDDLKKAINLVEQCKND